MRPVRSRKAGRYRSNYLFDLADGQICWYLPAAKAADSSAKPWRVCGESRETRCNMRTMYFAWMSILVHQPGIADNLCHLAMGHASSSCAYMAPILKHASSYRSCTSRTTCWSLQHSLWLKQNEDKRLTDSTNSNKPVNTSGQVDIQAPTHNQRQCKQ